MDSKLVVGLASSTSPGFTSSKTHHNDGDLIKSDPPNLGFLNGTHKISLHRHTGAWPVSKKLKHRYSILEEHGMRIYYAGGDAKWNGGCCGAGNFEFSMSIFNLQGEEFLVIKTEPPMQMMLPVRGDRTHGDERNMSKTTPWISVNLTQAGNKELLGSVVEYPTLAFTIFSKTDHHNYFIDSAKYTRKNITINFHDQNFLLVSKLYKSSEEVTMKFPEGMPSLTRAVLLGFLFRLFFQACPGPENTSGCGCVVS